jgi:hypothetical protein
MQLRVITVQYYCFHNCRGLLNIPNKFNRRRESRRQKSIQLRHEVGEFFKL